LEELVRFCNARPAPQNKLELQGELGSPKGGRRETDWNCTRLNKKHSSCLDVLICSSQPDPHCVGQSVIFAGGEMVSSIKQFVFNNLF